ncbi:MAG: ankyrin repeat domain-containing protein [Planctomycetota bacterium]
MDDPKPMNGEKARPNPFRRVVETILILAVCTCLVFLVMYKQRALRYAVENPGAGRTLLASAAILFGADIEEKDINQASLLFHAVQSDNMEMIEYLIAKGADVQSKMSDKSTLLHIAALQNNPEIVKYFLAKGLDPNAEAEYRATPLTTSPLTNLEVVKLLVEAGADVNHKTAFGQSVLEIAKKTNAPQEVVDYLTQHAAQDKQK